MSTASRHDAGSIERKKVGMIIPPPILLLLCSIGAALAQQVWFGGIHPTLAMSIAGGLAVAAGALLLGWCASRFRAEGAPIRPVAPPRAIVRKGPYAFSRNPMYLGMATVLAGLGVSLGSGAFALAMLLFLGVVHFGVVLREERYLERLHGEEYRRYKEAVRRWL
jgi:protein-S-isoprenylcysteine O-methyltransferase Ste14